jgi:hypothetical protein
MDDRGHHHEPEDYGSTRESLHHLVDELKSYARSRPIESLVIAFLMGVLVVLLGRRGR